MPTLQSNHKICPNGEAPLGLKTAKEAKPQSACTKQNGEKTDDYVVRGKNNKEDSKYFPSSSSSEDKRKTPLKCLKKQKLCNTSSSNSDNE